MRKAGNNFSHHSRGGRADDAVARTLKAQKRWDLGRAIARFAGRVNDALDALEATEKNKPKRESPCSDGRLRSAEYLGMHPHEVEYSLYAAFKTRLAEAKVPDAAAYWEARREMDAVTEWRQRSGVYDDVYDDPETAASAAIIHFIEESAVWGPCYHVPM